MKKLSFLFATLFILLVTFSNANALIFDPTGSGGSAANVDIATWDWAPNSAAAIGGNAVLTGDVFTLLTHGSLGIAYDQSSSPIIPSGLHADYEITFEAGFQELVTSGSITAAAANATFKPLAGGSTNFFNVYIDTARDADSDLSDGSAGTGFGASGTATLLFSGKIVGGTGSFSTDLTLQSTVLDDHGADDASATSAFGNNPQLTVQGTGGTTINTTVLFSNFNALYFPNITANLLYNFSTNTQNNIPFTNVDPSNKFWDGSAIITPSIGSVNGDPTNDFEDVVFQSDASTSEVGTSTVPEPGTMFLLGLGLLSLAGVSRKNLFKK
jgi:hypothetical protein